MPDVVCANQVALVIGNSAYEDLSQLQTPRKNAKAMAATLRKLGFKVLVRLDVDRSAFVASLDEFGRSSQGMSRQVLYYSGHGLQMNGGNHLLPVDAKLDEATGEIDPADAVSLDAALGVLSSDLNLVFLDASRDILPDFEGTGQGTGLARQCTDFRTVIGYAARPNRLAIEGKCRLSSFTQALLKHMGVRCVSIDETLRRVVEEVRYETDKRQEPWFHSFKALYSESFRSWRRCPQILPWTGGSMPPWPWPEQDAWRSVQHSKDPADFDAFLKAFPDGACCRMAKARRDKFLREKANEE